LGIGCLVWYRSNPICDLSQLYSPGGSTYTAIALVMTAVSHVSYGDQTFDRFTGEEDGPTWKFGSDFNHLNSRYTTNTKQNYQLFNDRFHI